MARLVKTTVFNQILIQKLAQEIQTVKHSWPVAHVHLVRSAGRPAGPNLALGPVLGLVLDRLVLVPGLRDKNNFHFRNLSP